MRAKWLDIRKTLHKRWRQVFGVRGGKTNSQQPLHLGYSPQQSGKIQFLRNSLAIGVYILAQKRDLPYAALNQAGHLPNNLVARAAALPTTDHWHYAVGAEIITTSHDGYVSAHFRPTQLGPTVRLITKIVGKIHKGLSFSGSLITSEHGRHSTDAMCPYHEIQVWQPSQQILAMLLSHTATESHYQSRLATLELLEAAQVAECLLLGFVANSAGVDEDKIRLAIIIHRLEIFLTKYFHQTFTVVTVHLAAERSDK